MFVIIPKKLTGLDNCHDISHYFNRYHSVNIKLRFMTGFDPIFCKGLFAAFSVLGLAFLPAFTRNFPGLQACLYAFFVGLCIVMLIFLPSCSKKNNAPEIEAGIVFENGMKHAKKHLYQNAIMDFEKVDGLQPYSEISKKASIMLIFCNFLLDNYEDVNAEAEMYTKLYPYDHYVPYIQYMKILSLSKGSRGDKRDINNSQDVVKEFNVLQNGFPKSAYVDLAEPERVKAEKLLFNSDINIAEFHRNSNNCLASIKRYIFIKQNFPKLANEEDYKIRISRSLDFCFNELEIKPYVNSSN